MKNFDFENDINVNMNDLDGEWIRQPALYTHWSIKYAEALAKKDKIWLVKRVLKARLYKKAKEEAEVTKKKKTDTGIEAEIRSNPAYEEISLKLIEAELVVNKLNAIKWGMVQKSDSLENVSRDDSIGYNMPDGKKELAGQSNNHREDAVKRTNKQSVEQDKEMRKGLKINRGNRK